MSVVLDNNKIGAVGEYVKENTKDGSVITISSPIFTIYAFEELRKVLEKSGKFKFYLMSLLLLSVLLPMIKRSKNLSFKCINEKEMCLSLIWRLD